ncbi:MAG: hypothetical protein PHT38_04235 [Halothiobacillus sp.]|jgi:hypothetical protein|nr:hypothetical protein [Halothiobacillus sp.]
MKFNTKLLAVAAIVISSASVANADETTYLSCASGTGASMKCEGVSLDAIMSMEATASLTGKKQNSVLFQCDKTGGSVQCKRMSVDLSMDANTNEVTATPNNSGIMAVPPTSDGGAVPPGRMKPVTQAADAPEVKKPPVYIQVTKPSEEGRDASKKAQPAKASTKAGDPQSEVKSVRVGPIKSGDTLLSLVSSHYGNPGNLRDITAAVFLANPNSFLDNNPSLLKAGAYLSMPPVSSVAPGLWSETKSKFYQADSASTKRRQDTGGQKSALDGPGVGIEPGDVVQQVDGDKPKPTGLIVSGSESAKQGGRSIVSGGGTDEERQKLIEQVLKIQGQINSLQKALPEK